MEDLQSKFSNKLDHLLNNCVITFRQIRVKKAIEIDTGKEVAVKILKIHRAEDSRKSMLESFYKEVTILS